MRRRVTTMIAVAALLIVGAAPALAAPGGIPGPPTDQLQGPDDVVVIDGDAEMDGPPDHAKAYGKRIKDAFGIPYGHVLQCLDDGPFDACEDALLEEARLIIEGWIFPEEPGAKVFWTEYEPFMIVAS